MRVFVFALAAGLAASPVAAVEDYDACVALVGQDAARALEEATAWAAFGGGAAARHCRALALVAAGAEMQAADELLGIAAEEPELSPGARADMLAQAGEMLVAAGDLVTAGLVSTQALSLAPADPDALALAASVRLAEGDAAGAKQLLGGAAAAGNARLLVLRAAAGRRLGDLVAARDDAVWAVELAPEMAGAWLERGRVAARIGDRASARQDFLRAIELDRDGGLGVEARLALQRMEAGIAE